MKLVLEPRFLFDGSVEATARSATGHHSNGDHHGVDSSDHAISAVAHSDTSGHSLTETHTPGLWQPYVPNATQILFVDTRVANWQQLIVGVAADVQVVVLDPTRSGVDQVTRALAGRSNLQGLQFLTDGTPGAIELGSTTLNAATLSAQSGAVTAWADHMAPHAQIALWGSEVGNGNAGAAFLASLHTLTGADIGAASHAVGSADMGASWQLDAKVGTFNLASPFAATALAATGHEILTDIPALAANPQATDLIFIDPRVAGWDILAAGATGNAQVILINPAQDAIPQISAALAGRSGVTALNLVAYGSAGALDLGATPINAASIAAEATAVAGWASHLAAGANLNLWGCDVAQGDGAALLAELNSLTGADVAASTTLVGNADFGGSWTLNTATGALDAALPFTVAAQAAFTNVLDPNNLTTTITADKSTAYSGDIITYTVVVGNPASHNSADSAITTTFQLPSNLSFVAGSLVQTGGPTAVLDATALTATLAGNLNSGQTMTFQVQGKVVDNLPSRTVLSAQALTSYTANFNTGDSDNVGEQDSPSVTTTIQTFSSTISIVAETNGNTSGVANATPQTAVNAAIGDIVRVHVAVLVPEGQNANSILDVTLPTGLAFQQDGAVNVALASPSGKLLSSTVDPTGTGVGQVSEAGGAITPASYAPSATAVIAAGNIDTTTAGHVKFNFGTLQNNDHSATANYIIVEFNAIVQNVAGNTTGTALTAKAVMNSTPSAAGTASTLTYTLTVPVTSTELSTTLPLALFDSTLGTLTKVSTTIVGTLFSTGSITDTNPSAASTVTLSDVQMSVKATGAPTNIASPNGISTVVSNSDSNTYVVPASGTVPIADIDGSSNNTKTSVVSGVLASYSTATPGTTTPITIKTSTSTLIGATGGNAALTQVSTASASLTVTYTYSQKPVTAAASGDAVITIVEPTLTIVKTVTAVNASTGAITYQDLITNTGNATAYGATLNDPEASSNEGAITLGATSGAATGPTGTGAPTVSVTGSAPTAAVTASFALAPSQTETITYTVAVTDKTAAVPNATTTVNWRSLSGDTQSLGVTATGSAGSTNGERTEPTGPAGSNGGVNTYTANTVVGFGAVSGKLWDELGPFNAAFGVATDANTVLAGITVTATGIDPVTGGAKTATAITDASGNYSFSPGTFGAGTVTVTVPAPGSSGLASSETLVDNVLLGTVASTSATTAAIGPASSVSGVNFIYQQPDVAPVISNWGGSAIPETGATPVALKGSSATGVADTPLNTLGALAGGVVGGNFGGTILTVARTAGTNGIGNTPLATDVFSGDGTNLVLAGSTVTLNSTTIGSYTLSGGTLTITFNNGVTKAQVAGVLDNLQYNTTATIPVGGATVTLTATLNDNNTTLYSTAVTGSAGRNLGTSGPLTGTAVATVALSPPVVATGGVSGKVWDQLGPATKVFGAAGDVDTNLAGITVTISYVVGGVTTTATTTTAADGTYSFTGIPVGAATVSLPLPGAGGLASNETLVLQASGNVGAGAATTDVSITSGATVSDINFIYQKPDVAPVISNWGGSAIPELGSVPVSLKGTLATGVSDTPIATLGGNYGGTTLTVGRTGGAVATDVFSGTGALSLTGGNVVLGGTTIGTYTQTGGTLAITFANATTNTQVAGVLDGLQYANTAAVTALGQTASITATLNDNNTTFYSALDSTSTGRNLGTSGPLTGSAVATVALAPAGSISGKVWDELGVASKTFGAAGDVDTNLAGITVIASYTVGGVTTNVTTTTAADGSYSFAAGTLPDGTITITLPTPGSAGLGASEKLVLQQIGSVGAGAATSSVTLAGAAVSNVNFIYQKPDVAPVISNWGGSAIPELGSVPVSLKGTLATGVSDTPIATLGGNYGGTTLTVGRTGGAVATDVFSGTGALSLTGGNVVLSGTTIGTYIQTGGTLAITFANATTNTQVAGVLDGLQYANTAAVTALGQTASITATLNDNNTTLYSALDGSSAASTGRNLGTSGPLAGSAVATVALVPAGSISGKVWDELGVASKTFGAAGDVDTNLAGITVIASYTVGGVTTNVTTTTAADGSYSFAAGTLPDGTITITLPTPGSAGLGASEKLVLQQIGSVGAGAATSSVTLAGAAVSNVNFIYQKPDVAPVISNWGGSAIPELGSVPVSLKGTLATGVSDTPIATLGGNYGGTTLTVGRTGGAVATDVFSGTGALSLTGGNVVLGGTTIGTYTQTGGTLAITFANATTNTQVAGVLDGLQYANTAAVTALGQTASITATLNDNNTTFYSALDSTSTGRNLGTSGPLTGSAVATVALAPAGSISGKVWDELGVASKTFGAAGDVDTNLAGITVIASYTVGGVTTNVTTTTAADGSYSFAAGTLPDGTITITLPTPGSAGLGASEKLVLQQIGSVGAGAATSSVTLAGAAVSNVNFIYQKPDVAPVISNWGGSAIPELGSVPVSLKGTLATGVSDTPIATLGGNYGGTTLTVGRTGGAVATDVFSGTGALSLTGGNVVLSGTTIGTYTQTGGTLAITFANATTNTQVAGVLDGLQYANTASVTALGQTASITATLNDNNTTLYTGLDSNSAGRNLGTSGPLTGSAVATVALAPAGSITGRVWDTLGPANLTYAAPGDVDTNLAGITVTATYVTAGVPHTVTTTTAADGTYTFAAGTLPDGPVTITLPTPGSAGLNAAETLVLQQIGAVGAGPATSSITLAGGPVNNVNFIYEKPDLAPVISGWGGSNIPETGTTPVPLKGFGATVSDTPIASLGGNYGGTILTVQRTGGANAQDQFTGDTALTLTGGTVTLGNTLIGSYSQTGGSLSITFANGATAAQVSGVLDHLTYSNTAADLTKVTIVSLSATLNDHNITSYGGTSPGYNLGTGGALNSNTVIATVAISPLPANGPRDPQDPPPPANPIENFGFGGANPDIIVDRPGRPETWLVGSDVRRFVIANQHAVEPLPPDMFYDTDPGAQLTLEAKQVDGRPLPDWLIFDSRGRVFYGTPPSDFHGAVDILINAQDDQGHRANGVYRILVGRDLHELEKLLAPQKGPRPLPHIELRGQADPTTADPVAVAIDQRGVTKNIHSVIDKTSPFAAISAVAVSTASVRTTASRPDFAQQLRDAGRMGRLGQARAVLRSLEGVGQNRPAA